MEFIKTTIMNDHKLRLAAFQDEDVALFEEWIDKEYIYKWFCCDGKEGEQARIGGLEEKRDWLDLVREREENPHIHLYIVTCDGHKIGFCIGIDLFGEPKYTKDQYPDLSGKLSQGEAIELGYCIGEESYLSKGLGKLIIKLLKKECCDLGASLVLADPSEENVPSVKALLSNGFEKYKDGDYRKQIVSNKTSTCSVV